MADFGQEAPACRMCACMCVDLRLPASACFFCLHVKRPLKHPDAKQLSKPQPHVSFVPQPFEAYWQQPAEATHAVGTSPSPIRFMCHSFGGAIG